ncbi:MAG TPA: hypothetical protein VEY09_12070 [Pyrinomonadaceae bacterium]|nr:hypothetical protein [Pyrinomonadaceae bacterium]
MKFRIFLVLILVVAAAAAGRYMNRPSEVDSESATARQEINERYALVPGARVVVRGISGSVEVRTAETDAAEVNIVSTARGTDNFEGRGVTVEHSPDELIVRGEKSAGNKFWRWLSGGGGGQVRHEVTLVLPRKVAFKAKGINGPVTVGEVEGSVEVSGVNGRVEVAGAGGRFAASGINGPVKVALGQIDERGAEVRGVNGPVEVRVAPTLNADVEVRGHNGSLTFDVPNLTSQERARHSKASARLGSGGTPVELTGINGNIRFVSTGGAPSGAVVVTPHAAPAAGAPPTAVLAPVIVPAEPRVQHARPADAPPQAPPSPRAP